MLPPGEARAILSPRLMCYSPMPEVISCDPSDPRLLEKLMSYLLSDEPSDISEALIFIKNSSDNLNLISLLRSNISCFLLRLDALSSHQLGSIRADSGLALVALFHKSLCTSQDSPLQAIFVLFQSQSSLDLGLSLLCTVCDLSATVKYSFIQSKEMPLILKLDLNSFSQSQLAKYVRLLAIISRNDFELGGFTSILSEINKRLCSLFNSIPTLDKETITECIRGMHFLATNPLFVGEFIDSGSHLTLLRIFPSLSGISRSFCLSSLGDCFCASEAAQKSIPVTIFFNSLDDEDEEVRVDAVTSIGNIVSHSESFQPSPAIEASFLRILVNDSFRVKKELIITIVAMINRGIRLELFTTDAFLDAVGDLIDSKDPNLNDCIVQIAQYFALAPELTSAEEALIEKVDDADL